MHADSVAKLNELKRLWVGLSVYYRTALDPEQLRMYAEDLEDLDILEVGRAVQMLRRDPTRKFLPLPAEVREKVLGNEAHDAQDAAGRIVEAMAKYGHTNGEKARLHVGELAWLVVQREGGWHALCERTQSDELPILKAQWREMAKVLRSKAIRGNIDQAPGLLPESAKEVIGFSGAKIVARYDRTRSKSETTGTK